MTTIKQALDYAKSININAIDSKYLLKFCTNFNNLDLLVNSDSNLTESEFSLFKECLKRRLTNEPIAYITGEKEFYGLNFKLDSNTLIPRPDTEILVDEVLNHIKENNIENPKILDLGTGSGAIIISILANAKNATGLAADINPNALKKAQENAVINNVSDRLEFVESNWFSNIKYNDFDIIVANPPYITTKMMNDLEKDVKEFEPNLALEGGELGYEPYIEIVANAPLFLKNKAKIFLEIGYDQQNSVLNLFTENFWHSKKCFKDYANNDRLIIVDFIKE